MKRRLHAQHGVTIIENLVAISLVAIALLGSTSLFINTYQNNKSARNFSSSVSDIQRIIDGYRTDYSSLLDEFGTDYTAITDNQYVEETVQANDSQASYTLGFTAIKTNSSAPPEAVRISVISTQRRGKFDDVNFTFETIIAQAN